MLFVKFENETTCERLIMPIDALPMQLDGAEPGEAIRLEIVEMTQEEYEALAEDEG